MGRVETKESAIASNIVHKTLFSANSLQLDLQEGTGVELIVQQVLVFNDLPYLAVLKKSSEVHVLLERGGLVVQSVLDGRVETRQTTLPAEGHEVWRLSFGQEPVLVSPVLAGSTHACLCFINNKGDSVSGSKSSKTLEESWSSNLVSKRADWLNDDGSDLAPGSF